MNPIPPTSAFYILTSAFYSSAKTTPLGSTSALRFSFRIAFDFVIL